MHRARTCTCIVDVHSPGPAFQKPSYFSFQKNYYNCMYMYMVLTTCVLTCTCTCTLAVILTPHPSYQGWASLCALELYIMFPYLQVHTCHVHVHVHACASSFTNNAMDTLVRAVEVSHSLQQALLALASFPPRLPRATTQQLHCHTRHRLCTEPGQCRAIHVARARGSVQSTCTCTSL